MRRDYKGPIEYSIEIAVEKIENLLTADYAISRRAIALLLLQDDEGIKERVRKAESENFAKIEETIRETKSHYAHPISYILAMERHAETKEIIKKVMKVKEEKTSFRERLSRLTMNPITGLPILFLVLYWGLYKFVGNVGAGVAVDYIESTIFEQHLNPLMINIVTRVIPSHILQDLFVGEYGIFTMGLRYSFAIILPIVTFFFIMFSIIEDSGYLPRLAMLMDRSFKKIGLSGRAVIPMVLGFGCVTMATMVTRTLPTKRERIIATMLLSLAVPCSAQLGVILALMENRPMTMLVWLGVVWAVFIFVGYLTAKILPGERPSFYMEVPPLRFPKLSNVFVKTYTRVKWYFKEVLPLFVAASFFIWAGKLTGVFDMLVNLLRKPVGLIGLPKEAAEIFLFGFFRRDYGAAGLYDLNKEGLLNGVQLAVACIALTLFLPCIAHFLMTVKERGWKTGLGISLFVLIFSFSVAFLVNLILTKTGVIL